MTALICGSLAYDNIMVFPDRFRNHILPESIHILNVCFQVPQMRREFGGCAGNIAYNLRMLGGDGKPFGTVGSDFGPYARWMDANGMSREHVKVFDDQLTAQAFITTDIDDNQITAFHPGAMDSSHLQPVPPDSGIRIGVVAPDGRQGMLEHARQFAEAGIPFLFDPGQGLPLFDSVELLDFVDRASWIAVNDYESRVLMQRTDLTIRQIASRVKALIVTRGAEGSVIIADNREFEIPVAKPDDVKDPTGCGDAYRAGLLYGLMNEMDWETTGRVASLIGAIKVANTGTQNHRVEAEEFASRFNQAFGYSYR